MPTQAEIEAAANADLVATHNANDLAAGRLIYERRKSGATWHAIIEDPIIVATYFGGLKNHPWMDGISVAMAQRVYAVYCARSGKTSEGPVAIDRDIQLKAMRVLSKAGWPPAKIAKAFGRNIKSVKTWVE